MIQIVMSIMAVSMLTGCASTKAYFVDRGRDAADVLTLCCGGGIGMKVRIGPVGAGLLAETSGAGLRGGELFAAEKQFHLPSNLDLALVCVGWEGFGSAKHTARHKTFSASTEQPRSGLTPFVYHLESATSNSVAFYTQIDAVIGLGLSVRAGFNPGELLDFILGWTTIDIYRDDIETQRDNKEGRKTPESLSGDQAHFSPQGDPQ